MNYRNTFIFLTLILFFSCQKNQKTESEILFEQAFKIIKTNYFQNKKVDWREIINNVKDSIKNFNNDEDTNNAIKYVLNQINDKHGKLLLPKEPTNFFKNDKLKIPLISYQIINNKIGYIKIPGFGANDSLSNLYSLNIRKTLKKIDNESDLEGWIIDLRDNFGGKLSVFSLGVSPLFKDSIIGYSLNNKKLFNSHKIINNTYYFNEKKFDSLNFDNTLRNKDKKIAFLVNHKTASMGEFLVISFKTQKKTKTFGTKTRGLTTILNLYNLNNGSSLLLTVGKMSDNNKQIQNGPIIPDIECNSEKSIELAIEWINNAI